jgi:hypothetical protein
MEGTFSDTLLHALWGNQPDERRQHDALEGILRAARVEPALDGVRFWRVVADTPHRAEVCGEVWTLTGATPVFWLTFEPPSAPGGALRWTLRYDVVAPPRFARHAVHLLTGPDDARWRVIVSA